MNREHPSDRQFSFNDLYRLNPDAARLYKHTHKPREIEPDRRVTALSLLTTKWQGVSSIDIEQLSKFHGVNTIPPTLKITPDILKKYQELTVYPVTGGKKVFPLSFTTEIQAGIQGSDVTIFWTSPDGDMDLSSYFRCARYWFT